VCVIQRLFGIVLFFVAMGLLYSVCAVLQQCVRPERHFSGIDVESLQGGEIPRPAVNSTAPSYVAGMAETHTRPASLTSFKFFSREKAGREFDSLRMIAQFCHHFLSHSSPGSCQGGEVVSEICLTEVVTPKSSGVLSDRRCPLFSPVNVQLGSCQGGWEVVRGSCPTEYVRRQLRREES